MEQYGLGLLLYEKRCVVDSDIYRRYCKIIVMMNVLNIKKCSSSSGECYLTSVCINANNLSDNCLELAVFRDFRDNWLRKQPEGQNEIEEYYSIAPKIVDAINARSDANDLWSGIFNNLVIPCLEWINKEDMEQAYECYHIITRDLADTYL